MTAGTPPTDAQRQIGEYLGVPLNPDTNAPFPTASQAQLELVDELLDRLDDDDSFELRHEDLSKVRDALVEAVVRQHGRTLRACIAEVRDTADERDLEARRHAQDALDSSTAPARELRDAVRYTEAASTLRAVLIRGDRA